MNIQPFSLLHMTLIHRKKHFLLSIQTFATSNSLHNILDGTETVFWNVFSQQAAVLESQMHQRIVQTLCWSATEQIKPKLPRLQKLLCGFSLIAETILNFSPSIKSEPYTNYNQISLQSCSKLCEALLWHSAPLSYVNMLTWLFSLLIYKQWQSCYTDVCHVNMLLVFLVNIF